MFSVQQREARLRRRLEKGDPYWPAQLAIALAIAISLALSDRVTVGPRFALPAVEVVLLGVVAWIRPDRATRYEVRARRLALAVIGLVSATYVVSLALLIDTLLNQHLSGKPLVLSGAGLLATNVLLFAVWYWEFDRGGPANRFLAPDTRPDFQFPQMDNPQFAPPGWRPGFFDYQYMALTNATAFSPTDTMPLTHAAKALMSLQSVSALATIVLVVARAVNVLG